MAQRTNVNSELLICQLRMISPTEHYHWRQTPPQNTENGIVWTEVRLPHLSVTFTLTYQFLPSSNGTL
jgi:hypothetical protein